jgi:hypothetical protein
MAKRKIPFNEISSKKTNYYNAAFNSDCIKRIIYEYDNTYMLIFNNVLKQLININNKKKENKLKNAVVNLLKNEWYNDEFNDYLFPSVNFNIIIKAMKNDIKKSISEKNIKLILRSFCHYNNSDGLTPFYNETNRMLPIWNVNINNEYDNDTVRTCKIQIFNFLKDIIDDNKLEEFLFDFIEDNKSNMSIEDYIISDRYLDLKQSLIEDDNIINVFKNYDLNQPHLYNYLTKCYIEDFKLYYENQKNRAIKLYIRNNGLSHNTIRIKYNNL